ncbi:hypothetical protein Q8G50_33865, partial [Klebsiella pneumoniae]
TNGVMATKIEGLTSRQEPTAERRGNMDNRWLIKFEQIFGPIAQIGQGSETWARAGLGVITASGAHNVISKPK